MSKYKNQYCVDLIKDMGRGHSILAWAGKIGVSRQTIYNWMKEFPEFKEATKIGYNRALRFWEYQLTISMKKFGYKPSVAIFVLKTRFHKEYGDLNKDKSEGKGKSDSPQTITETYDQYIRRIHDEKIKENAA